MIVVSLKQTAGNDPGLKVALTDAYLPTDDIEDDGRTLFKAISADDRIVGFSGIELYGIDYLLRSVVVLPEHGGQSLGRAVVEQTLARLDRGDVFLATTNAARSLRASDFPKCRGTARPHRCWRRASFSPSVHHRRPS